MVLDKNKAERLAELVREWNGRGWSPATSTNYSFRNDERYIAISKSGVDKSKFGGEDFLLMELAGERLADIYPSGTKTSAETGLHTALYKVSPKIGAVVHTHSIYNTVLSDVLMQGGQNSLRLSNYELLKALGYATHEVRVEVPIFANTQDIEALAKSFEQRYAEQPDMRGYLISGHGFYTWGENIEEAKRHLEAFEFLFECHYKALLISKVL